MLPFQVLADVLPQVTNVISENSTVTVGVLIGVALFVFGTIWWASSVQTKLDSIFNLVTKYESGMANVVTRLDAIEKDIVRLQEHTSIKGK